MVEPDELLTLTDIADLLGVQVSAVSNYRRRHADFPQPWGTFANGSLWRRTDIEAWTADREARAGEARARRLAQLRAQVAMLERGDTDNG